MNFQKDWTFPVYDRAYIEQQVNDRMYDSEAEAIRNLAEKPCIILGRCASDILKDRMNVLNIFVCADKEDRIKRIMKLEDLSYEDAKRKSIRLMNSVLLIIMNIQEKPGGDVNDYHMILDTSALGSRKLSGYFNALFRKTGIHLNRM